MILRKPRIRFIFGRYRATCGIHNAVGSTPLQAYNRLIEYLKVLGLGSTT